MTIAKVRTGTESPNNSIGIDGDVYINTSTQLVYTRIAGVYTITINNSQVTTANLFNYYNFI